MPYFNMSEFLRTFTIHYPYSFKKQINTYMILREIKYIVMLIICICIFI